MGISRAGVVALTLLPWLGCDGAIGDSRNLDSSFVDAPQPAAGGPARDGGIFGTPEPGNTPDASVPMPPVDCNPATAEPLPARAIRIDRVTINQGVSIPIVEDGETAQRQAPLVADRAGVLRVFVEPEPDWQTRETIVRLNIDERQQDARRLITAASTADSLEGTINFTVPPGELSEESELSIELFELDPCGAYAGDAEGSRFPMSGDEPLGVEVAPGAFRIVLVPVRYLGDGSGLEPTLDASTIERFTDRMHALYPLTDLDISILDNPLDFDRTIGPDGEGWSDLLAECLSLRADDGAAPNTYYYCALRPTSEAPEFCSQGCIAGLGPVPSAGDTFNRASIGLLYENGVGTFLHEMGHTLGLQHAPCGGVAGADPDFPYADGGIGVLGFDVAGQRLLDTEHRDIMGYCGPAWISDYHYERLYERLVTVTAPNATSQKSSTRPTAAWPVVIDSDGSLTLGNRVVIEGWPVGEEIAVEWAHGNGATQKVIATLVRVSHLPGGIVYVPELGGAPGEIRIPGYGGAAARR